MKRVQMRRFGYLWESCTRAEFEVAGKNGLAINSGEGFTFWRRVS